MGQSNHGTKLTIRDATLADRADLIRIRNAPAQIDSYLRRGQREDVHFVVGETGGCVVAFSSLIVGIPGDTGLRPKISDLFVRTDCHSLGIGSRILTCLEARARSAGRREIYLSVEVENHRAHAFYSRLGYVRVSETPTERTAKFHHDDGTVEVRSFLRYDMRKILE